MSRAQILVCDGCGQPATATHLAARLRRLEWSTRYRPVHVQTLLVGGVAPLKDEDFLYAPREGWTGEAARVLKAAGISTEGKTSDAVHHQFQRAGLFLVYLMDCPLESDAGSGMRDLPERISARVAPTLTRIRRSIKPKQVAFLGQDVQTFLPQFSPEALGCGVLLDGGGAFKLIEDDAAVERLRGVLSLSS